MSDREYVIAAGFYGFGIAVGLAIAYHALSRAFAEAEAREKTRRELYNTLLLPRSPAVDASPVALE